MFKLKDIVMGGGGMPGSGGGSGNGGGGSGNGGGGGMGGGMGGNNACFIYDLEQAVDIVDPDVTPDIVFNRQVYMNGSIQMDGPGGAGTAGESIAIWGFNGTNSTTPDTTATGGGMNMGGPFPSPAMRLTSGDIAHTFLSVGMGGDNGGMGMGMWKHTIHHHGIEPEYRSDGVGHTSWDVAGSFTYQWQPNYPGTYFYHCHVNTVLHAEMGMYGALIVDPKLNKDTVNNPQGLTYANEDLTSRYDVEAIWAVDEIDSSWRVSPMEWAAGTCGGDVGFNTLNPDYFVITGVDASQGVNSSAYKNNDPQTQSVVAATVEQGQKLLIRYIVAGYLPQKLMLPPGFTGRIVASDGRPLPNEKIMAPANSGERASLFTVSAERYDIIIDVPANQAIGDYAVDFDIQDWISGDTIGTATTRITVTAPTV